MKNSYPPSLRVSLKAYRKGSDIHILRGGAVPEGVEVVRFEMNEQSWKRLNEQFPGTFDLVFKMPEPNYEVNGQKGYLNRNNTFYPQKLLFEQFSNLIK